MRSGNPTLGNNVFTNARNFGLSETMTVDGAVNKTFILLFILIGVASLIWRSALSYGQNDYGEMVVMLNPSVMPWMIVGGIGGLIVAFATIFKPQWSPISAPVYAALEGLVIGGLSAVFEQKFPGIVMQAVGLTFAVLFAMLMAYKTGVIKATPAFRRGVISATIGIALFYFASLIFSFFGMGFSIISSSSVLGIGFSLFVVVIAALNLVLDFDLIERGSQQGAPKFMEWYGAFALMVTLIWLYMEILRLLAKMQSRR